MRQSQLPLWGLVLFVVWCPISASWISEFIPSAFASRREGVQQGTWCAGSFCASSDLGRCVVQT
jgi:hypothetical protein